MRKAAELISKQPPMTTNAAVLQRINPDNARIIVSISKQRALLLTGDEIGIDSPISSGKRGHGTPTGSFSVLQKDKDHRSSLYGDYKDSKGRTVRGGISARIDSAPSGTRSATPGTCARTASPTACPPPHREPRPAGRPVPRGGAHRPPPR